jgi:acyl carrier protein
MNTAATIHGQGSEQHFARDPHPSAVVTEQPRDAGLTATQASVCQICRDALKAERVGLSDDFFDDLGGTSLVLIHILAQINEQFGVSVDASALIDRPTMGRLAECVDAALLETNR